MQKSMTFQKRCNPPKLIAELVAANILVSGVQSSPTQTTVLADGDEESAIASVVAAHTYEPIKFGKRLVG